MAMHTWFECKIRYEKTMENGMQKKVTEPYLVDALSFTEAEARIIEDTEGHIPAPVTGAVTFEVDGIAGRRETTEHEPEGDDKRNDFHADHRVSDQVNA